MQPGYIGCHHHVDGAQPEDNEHRGLGRDLVHTHFGRGPEEAEHDNIGVRAQRVGAGHERERQHRARPRAVFVAWFCLAGRVGQPSLEQHHPYAQRQPR